MARQPSDTVTIDLPYELTDCRIAQETAGFRFVTIGLTIRLRRAARQSLSQARGLMGRSAPANQTTGPI
jgi:hypothetical protein